MVDLKFINDFKRKHVDTMRGTDPYVVPLRPHPHSTEATRRTTSEMCLWLAAKGYWYACEVSMKGRKRRADILVPEFYEAQVIEIHDSEGSESLEAKKKFYELRGITMLAVPANPREAISLLESLIPGLKLVNFREEIESQQKMLNKLYADKKRENDLYATGLIRVNSRWHEYETRLIRKWDNPLDYYTQEFDSQTDVKNTGENSSLHSQVRSEAQPSSMETDSGTKSERGSRDANENGATVSAGGKATPGNGCLSCDRKCTGHCSCHCHEGGTKQ